MQGDPKPHRWLLTKSILLLAVFTTLSVACSPGIKDVWVGTGEIWDAKFFDLDLNLQEKKPFGILKWGDGGELLLAVCALQEQDGVVSFKMDVDAMAASCDNIVQPLVFSGEFGRDALVGIVTDSNGIRRGMFRAFRVSK